ncbi:F-BAR domain only protein 1 isoform X1 [Cheilinus undulatus]|uniref:F-BAR domain only protein 1 isoform X1 n=2 Tax=Cheilinus undulatus TaxID=241271 RepID=UPI001BD27E99|nr:F-BAR domain only protein 1 isoform X1 [Cheilinus undulatus]XP_041646542.1 F-BAR domain only protein 1 isoform X1 [Cheilinus undulatus]XP_041646543.1 F-BAR domain only protein 1 isoform X1 [Cheilinus undulatus]XP_041646544.1 F-BAR domain only protein 1 isoform X1 [Cheilinus undulatus]XP_041646545.1 F-BAR domain only protein 1 isoform X1 [Cheilinus undulatus]
MAFFQNNFWGEKNAGFDVLYHNMKHGQLATKELAEFVRESAAVEETYSKSMSKLAKMASNGSPQGTFAPMWDVFRVSSDKLALCHLELMRKMNDLIRDINKYGDEQVKIHRKTKEEMVGTVEAVQALQVQSSHLQKSKEGYHAKCLELDRLRKEGAPQKELEKAELKSKKAAESFALCIEKYNRVGGEFEQKMSESAQKFQEIEEAHLRQMKQLIKGYSHSIEDTHVQVGQVHEEFKQNVENIGIDNLIQKFAEQKGTGKDRPALVGFEEYMTAPEGGKKSRAKAFRIPGLGKRDKEPDSTDSAVTEALNSPLEVDDEGFVIRADSTQNGCSEEKENNFYSSDSDFDDEEPKKFHIQIRPVASSNRSNSAATEKELKATIGALTLPPNRAVRQQVPVKRHLSRNSSTTGRSEEGKGAFHRDGDQEGLRRSTSSPDHSRLGSTASGSDSLFGPPLESAFKSKSFDSREQLREQSTFGASEYAAFSSDSSSPENVEDSGLDSPSHQTLGPSPEPAGWAAWPPVSQSKEQTQTLGRPADPFLSAFRDPSPGRSPLPQDDPASVWSVAPSRPSRVPSDMDPSSARFPAFSQSLPPPEIESSVWNCKHIPPEDPFLAAFERTVTQETINLSDAWSRPPPRQTPEGRGMEVRVDPFSMTLPDTKKLPTSSSSSSSSSSHRKDRERKRDRSLPPPVTSDDPFAITMIGSPTHQSSLAAAAGLIPSQSSSNIVSSNSSNRVGLDSNSSSLPTTQPKKELMHWNSLHNPFNEGVSKTQEGGGKGEGGERRKHRSSESEPRRNAPPLTRHSGPQEDLCFSTDKDQDCLDLNSQIPCSVSSHKGSKHNFRQDTTEVVSAAPQRAARAKRTSGRLSGCERSRSLCSSPLPEPSPSLTSSSSSSPSEWGPQARDADWAGQNRAASPARPGQVSPLPFQHQDHQQRPLHLSRGPSPISLSTQEAWPVAAAITEYINAYFKGGQHNRCLVKITGDLTMSFPAGITRIFTANPNVPVLSFRLVNISRIDHFLPNQKLLYSDPSQSDPDTRDFWFNMQALQLYLQRESELNPQASYYNVGLLKYQVSSQDPGRAPLLLSAECQRSGTVTRVSLDYHCCPATAPSTQLTAVQVLLPLDHTATDLQCQPAASWNAEERRLLWKLPNLSPTNHSKGSGTLCASWQCLEVPRGPPPSLAVQFVGSGASLSGMDVELVGSRYRMSLVKKRFATGKYMAGCSL